MNSLISMWKNIFKIQEYQLRQIELVIVFKIQLSNECWGWQQKLFIRAKSMNAMSNHT